MPTENLLPTPLRMSVVGCSGSGKSTLAVLVHQTFGMTHVELDSLYHQADWKPLDTELFLQRTRTATPASGAWVTCGNYNSTVGDDLQSRANVIVFLDLPKRTVMRRIVKRSLGRVFGRKELWNGNRERWINLLHPNPKENIILWAFTQWGHYRKQYRQKMKAGAWKHARVVHLQTIASVDEFIRTEIRL